MAVQAVYYVGVQKYNQYLSFKLKLEYKTKFLHYFIVLCCIYAPKLPGFIDLLDSITLTRISKV